MDTWTREQVEVRSALCSMMSLLNWILSSAAQHMKNTGNVKSNSYYNPDEKRHPPPTNMVDSERDSELEKFIRGARSYNTLKPPVSSAPMQPNMSSSLSSTAGPLPLRSLVPRSPRAGYHPAPSPVRKRHPLLRRPQRHPCHHLCLPRTHPQPLRWLRHPHQPNPHYLLRRSGLHRSLCQVPRPPSLRNHRSPLGRRASPLPNLRHSNPLHGQHLAPSRRPPLPLNHPSRPHNRCRCNRRTHRRSPPRTHTPGCPRRLAPPFRVPYPLQR